MAKATRTPTTPESPTTPNANAERERIAAERKAAGKVLADAYLSLVSIVGRKCRNDKGTPAPLKCPTLPRNTVPELADAKIYAARITEYAETFSDIVAAFARVETATESANQHYAKTDTVAGFGRDGMTLATINTHRESLWAFATGTVNADARNRFIAALSIVNA